MLEPTIPPPMMTTSAICIATHDTAAQKNWGAEWLPSCDRNRVDLVRSSVALENFSGHSDHARTIAYRFRDVVGNIDRLGAFFTGESAFHRHPFHPELQSALHRGEVVLLLPTVESGSNSGCSGASGAAYAVDEVFRNLRQLIIDYV